MYELIQMKMISNYLLLVIESDPLHVIQRFTVVGNDFEIQRSRITIGAVRKGFSRN